MPHSPSGPCAVCGVSTTQRCASCAEAGVNVFLCGREHQKLVWFAHKLACGVKPFRFPPLTSQEVEDAERRQHDEVEPSVSISVYLSKVFSVGKADVPAVLSRLERDSSTPYAPAFASAGCAIVRGVLSGLARKENASGFDASSPARVPSSSKTLPPIYLASHAAVASAFFSSPAHKVSLEPYLDVDNLYSPFHHLLLIYGGLYQLFHQQPSVQINITEKSAVDKYVLQLYKQLEPYACSTVFKNPRASGCMLAAAGTVPEVGTGLLPLAMTEAEYQRLLAQQGQQA